MGIEGIRGCVGDCRQLGGPSDDDPRPETNFLKKFRMAHRPLICAIALASLSNAGFTVLRTSGLRALFSQWPFRTGVGPPPCLSSSVLGVNEVERSSRRWPTLVMTR